MSRLELEGMDGSDSFSVHVVLSFRQMVFDAVTVITMTPLTTWHINLLMFPSRSSAQNNCTTHTSRLRMMQLYMQLHISHNHPHAAVDFRYFRQAFLVPYYAKCRHVLGRHYVVNITELQPKQDFQM